MSGVTRWRSLRLRTRLLGLVVLPFVGISLVAAPMLRDRVLAASATRAADAEVVRLLEMDALRSALLAEISPTEAAVRASAFGVPVAQASVLLGYDVIGRLPGIRAATDDALVVVSRSHPGLADNLRALRDRWRAAFDGGGSVDNVHGPFEDGLKLLEQARSEVLKAAVTTVARDGRSGGGVETAVAVVVEANTMSQAAQNEVDALFRVMFPQVSGSRLLARDDLAANRRLYAHAADAVAIRADATVTAALAVLGDHPDTKRVEAAIDAQLGPATPASLPVAELASVFRSSFVRASLLDGLTRAAATYAMDTTSAQRDAARQDLRNAIGLLGGLVAITAFAAVAIANAITRRLRPLGVRAAEISRGVLDGPPADERGPEEITVVARALNDTVESLQLVERQARTLATGALDDPILQASADGPLGITIQQAVTMLADAWRDREDLQHRLAHQANHDLLTGLPNRKGALEAIEAALARAGRRGETVAVLFVDLDEFKRVNDAYGHHAGDQILRLCAERLAAAVRAGDVLARLGGDEFVVVTDRVRDARAAVELGQRLITAASESFQIDGITTHLGASVGVGLATDGPIPPLDLLRDADNAVHRAKRLGRGRVEIFDEHARNELAADNHLEHALRLALEREELTLHYQPITDTATGAVRGFEALARWTLDHQPVPPSRFVAVAEQSDLVNDLGRWALRTATEQLQAWNTQGLYTDAYIAVNVSGRHLVHQGFLDDVTAALDASNLPAALLVIEITETVVVDDLVTAADVLGRLHDLGVRVALDDFGTGYTSIGQLWRLPVDLLKIDGTFIRQLHDDSVLVRLMVDVAHTLGLGLVAEGVETTDQRSVLRQLECDAIQGYLVCRPQAPDALPGALSVGA